MTHHKITLLITTILFSTVGFAQAPDTVFIRQDHHFDDTLIYATDTVFFGSGMTKHILMGTTILPSTHNQMIARGYGIYLADVTKSECQADAFEKSTPDNINSIISTDSTLTVDINITDNCCYEFLCDMSIDSTGTLNLIYYGYGTYCACDCCFGLTFHFIKEKYYKDADLHAVMINNNRKTIKQLTK